MSTPRSSSSTTVRPTKLQRSLRGSPAGRSDISGTIRTQLSRTRVIRGPQPRTGAYVLFLNNDVEPINEGWLGAMVDAVEADSTAVAAGAVLIYPEGRHTRNPSQAPLTVQHRGIAFAWHNGHPQPINLGLGEPPLSLNAAEVVDVPAATAACLLVEASAFVQAGAFSPEYDYGWEDTDLCMKLREHGGKVLVSYGATLFHYEFGTQETLEPEIRREKYVNNSTTFIQRWSPQLRRLYQSDLLVRRQFWAANITGSIAITVTDLDKGAGFGDWYTAHELGEGTRVSWLEDRVRRAQRRCLAHGCGYRRHSDRLAPFLRPTNRPTRCPYSGLGEELGRPVDRKPSL